MNHKTSITNLPEEVIVLVFAEYIKSEGLGQFLRNVSVVCKKWKKASQYGPFWRSINDPTLDREQLLWLSKAGYLAATQVLKLSHHQAEHLSEWDIADIIEHCPKLQALKLVNNKLTSDVFKLVGKKCPKLDTLWLFGLSKGGGSSFCTSSLLDPFLQIRGSFLKYLDLSGNILIDSFDWDLMERIAETCHALEEFFFYVRPDHHFEFHFPIAKFQEGCPRLRVLKLKLSYCDYCSTCREAETRGFPHLETFRADILYLRDVDLGLILHSSAELKELELNDCPHITSKSILDIPSSKLQKLSLSGMRAVDISSVLTKWRLSLTNLVLHNDNGGRDAVDAAMRVLLQCNPVPPIESLDLSFSRVSFSVLVVLVRKCTHLRELCTYCCRLLPRNACRKYCSRAEVERFSEFGA